MARFLVRREKQLSGQGYCSVPVSSIHFVVKTQNPSSPLRFYSPSREDLCSATQYFSCRLSKETISLIHCRMFCCYEYLYVYIYVCEWIYSVFDPLQTGPSQCHKADFNVPFTSGFSSLEQVSADILFILLCRISPWYFHHNGGLFSYLYEVMLYLFLSSDHWQYHPYFYRKKIIKTTFPFY